MVHARGTATAVPISWGSRLSPELLEPVDIVVAADVAYLRPMMRPLLATILQLMGETTVLILAQSEGRGQPPIPTDEIVAAFQPHVAFESTRLTAEAMDESVDLIVGRLRSGPGAPRVSFWFTIAEHADGGCRGPVSI